MNSAIDPHSGTPLDPTTAVYRLGAGGPSLVAGLAAAGATGRRVALLHIDIDRLGAINESMGEVVGDKLLAAIAQRLQKEMPGDAWLWRLGSDEFLAGIGYRDDEPDGLALAERLREAFEAPLSIPPYVLRVTLAIGIAVYPDDARDAASLLAKAEQVVRVAKREGRNGIGLSAI